MNTITSITLLDGLRDPGNTTAWRRFNDRYRPMVVAFSRKQGLGETDAEDVAQDTLVAFSENYGQGGYDRGKGRLRSWLFAIAHHKVVDLLRRRLRENVVQGAQASGILKSLPSEDEAEQQWEQEWKRFVLKACLEEVKQRVAPKTYMAFELYVLHQWPVESVAERLGMTENAVYIAKNRVSSVAKEVMPQMEDVW